MQINLLYILLILLVLNTRTYYLMVIDKRRAIKKKWRISEAKLLWGSALFGSMGIWLGMFAPLYHKRNKPVFAYGVPLMMVVQAIILFWLYGQFQNWLYFEL